MRIAVCDDDIICRGQISNMLNEYIRSRKQSISVTVYENGKDLIEDSCKIGGYDIYILDVMMPEISGIEMGVRIRSLGLPGKIVYLTGSDEYAIDAFRARAFNYILKPVEQESFFTALDEVISVIDTKKDKYIVAKTKEGSIKLAIDTIFYAELSKRNIIYHLESDETLETTSIRIPFSEAMQELLDEKNFVLCGASTVVNLQYVTMVENEALVFQNGSRLYIGKRAGREIRSVWYDFWINE